MPTVSSPTISGISSSACSICGSKSSCVNGNSVGESDASSIEGISSGSCRIAPVRVGADLEPGAVLALVHVRVHVADDRELDALFASRETRHRPDVDHLVHRRE